MGLTVTIQIAMPLVVDTLQLGTDLDMDRTGKMTLATTDTNLATIFMSRSLSGALLMKSSYP